MLLRGKNVTTEMDYLGTVVLGPVRLKTGKPGIALQSAEPVFLRLFAATVKYKALRFATTKIPRISMDVFQTVPVLNRVSLVRLLAVRVQNYAETENSRGSKNVMTGIRIPSMGVRKIVDKKPGSSVLCRAFHVSQTLGVVTESLKPQKIATTGTL
jgi:hypothetical protein